VLTPTVVQNTRFTMTRLRPGYQPRAVDAFLDRIGAGLDRLIRENEELRAQLAGARHGGTGLDVRAPSTPPPSGAALYPVPLTPVDVRFAQFALTRPGYEPSEVDAFLDRIEAGLDGLIRENEEIRAPLAGTRYGGNSPRPPVPPPSPPPFSPPASLVPGPRPGPGPEKAGGSSSRGRGSGFVRLLALALFFAVLAIAPGVAFASSYSAVERSSYTQASGIPDSATVISERVGTGKAAETDLTVRLATPVGGQDTSVVNIAGAHRYPSGQKISVLVDPRDPSYSELPGLPDDLPLETAVATALIIVLLTAAVVASLIAAFRKLLRRPRDRRSPRAPEARLPGYPADCGWATGAGVTDRQAWSSAWANSCGAVMQTA
jgi:DivIVA domain-containing protein